MDAAGALGLLLYVAGALGVIHLMAAAVRWVVGSEEWRGHALWGVVLVLVSVGGLEVAAWLLGPGSGGPAAPEGGFIIVPGDYFSESGGVLRASKYYPIEVLIIPVQPPNNVDYWDVCVEWGDGFGVCSPPFPPSQTPLLRYTHAYRNESVYTVNVTVRGWVAQQAPGLIPPAPVKIKESVFEVNVTAPWREYAAVVKRGLEQVPDDAGPIEGAVISAMKKVFGALADAWAWITDFLASWLSELGVNPGEAYYYLVAMPTLDNMPVLETVYNAYRFWGSLALALLALAGLVWKGLFEYGRGGGALFDWLRDLLLVAVGMYVALPLYDAVASAWNLMTLSVARLDQLGAIYVMLAVGVLVLGAVGILNPGAGALAANLAIVLLVTVALGVLKWIVAAVLVSILPLALALWVFDATRGVASAVIRSLVALFVFSAAVAALTALTVDYALSLTLTGTGRNLLFAAILPLVTVTAGYMVAGAAVPGGLPGFGVLAGLRAAVKPPTAPAVAAPAPVALPPPAAAPVAAQPPAVGAVVGYAPSPPVAYAPAAAPAVRPLSAPLAPPQPPSPQPPAPPRQPTRPEIREVPRAVPQRLRELADVARGRLDVDASQAGVGARAAYAAAMAAGWLGSRVAQELRAFDNELARRVGVTPVRAAERAAKAAIKAAEAGYKAASKAASWVAPYAVRLGERARTWYNENVRVWVGFRQDRGLVVELR